MKNFKAIFMKAAELSHCHDGSFKVFVTQNDQNFPDQQQKQYDLDPCLEIVIVIEEGIAAKPIEGCIDFTYKVPLSEEEI
mmetsp:Transcript_16194/g.15585  ORF Transcript_16194/g.15585 Transcript_16194/m.15585 type:complete len:80 (+) Transcript_16194:303-542(+)